MYVCRPGSSSSDVLRGQQLLAELEEELQQLDAAAVGPGGEVARWQEDVEGLLARMDCLTSGYQVDPTHKAAARAGAPSGSGDGGSAGGGGGQGGAGQQLRGGARRRAELGGAVAAAGLTLTGHYSWRYSPLCPGQAVAAHDSLTRAGL